MIDELIQTMACAASPPPEQQAVSAVTAVPCFCTAHWPSPLTGELRAGLEDAGLSRRSAISSPPG